MKRREFLLAPVAAAAASAASATPPAVDPQVVKRNDAAVERMLESQITDPASPWRGSIPDEFGLHSAGSAGGVAETMTASFLHPQSKFHADNGLVERMHLAAEFLERSQSPQGNIDLLSTNFNSPPDTGFAVHNAATAAAAGRRYGAEEIARMLRLFLVKAAAGMAAEESTLRTTGG